MMRKLLASSIGMLGLLVACSGGSAPDSPTGSGREPGSSAREPGAAGPESASSGQDPAPSNGDAPGCLKCGQLYKCQATLPGELSASTSLIALPGEGCPVPTNQTTNQTDTPSAGSAGSSNSGSSNSSGTSGSSSSGSNGSSGGKSNSQDTVYLQFSCGGAVRAVGAEDNAVIGTWRDTGDGELLACFGVLGSNVCVVCSEATASSQATGGGTSTGGSKGTSTFDAGSGGG